jgi:signal transduction histidine kinase
LRGEVPVVLIERRLVRQDGAIIWVEVNANRMRSLGGGAISTAVVVQDITERKAADQTILTLNHDLERRVMERTESLKETRDQLETFCYSIAHDLRAPLRAMQGFSQALLEDFGSRLDADGRDYAQRISGAAHRMDALVMDLLNYSRLSRQDLQFTAIELRPLLEGVLAEMAELVSQSNANIRLEGSFPTVTGHEPTLRLVLTNLISNAVKFVQTGVTPQVKIWSVDRKGRARLWIEDNGIGIAPEHQDRIFGVFERLQASEAFPGTGMGLAIVRKGIERMGGAVGVESELGVGSRFWIELPLVLV